MRSFARQIPERLEIANWKGTEALSDSVLHSEAEAAFAEKQKIVRVLRGRLDMAYDAILDNAETYGLDDSGIRACAFLNVLHNYHWYKEHGLEFIYVHD